MIRVCRCRPGLVKQFRPDLKFRADLVRERGTGQAEILGTPTADHASSTPEGGPAAAPIFLDPDWKKQRGTVVTDRTRAAWQKYARKNTDAPADGVLVQELVLGGKLDIARADAGFAVNWTIEAASSAAVS
jgi:hypothetical protein